MQTRPPEYKEWKRKYDIKYRVKTKKRREKLVRDYYLKNKYEIRKYLNEYQNKWRKTLRGRIAMRLSNANRRKRVRETKDGTVTRIAVEKLYFTQKKLCAICNKKLVENKMHLDHILQLAKKGKHTIINVQWTCAKCNLKKH